MYLEKIFKRWLYLSWKYVERVAIEKRRWKSNPREGDPSIIRVLYGHDNIPERAVQSSGGLIKFQDLCEVFPNIIINPNILYLVSSALPVFPEVMVREAKRHGVVFVLNQNGVAYPAWHGPGWEKTNRPNRLLLEQADYVIYQSRFSKIGADKFLAPCQVPWTILHNPVDTKVFSPPNDRRSGIRILLAGSHHQLYRIQTALETLRIVRTKVADASLTIAGRYAWRASESECLDEARGLAQYLGIYESVEFSGGYTQTDAPSLFQRHHILLHTQYNDCCPRLVVEAMACGLPVIYSKSGGVPELVGDIAGEGVDSKLDWENEYPPDPVDLAKAALKVIASLEDYSVSARERAANNFDVEPWKEKHAVIFHDLLQKKVN